MTGSRAGLAAELAALFVRDLGRLADELRALPDTRAAWETAPGVTNAAGTLALHLEGNLREYVGRQLGRVEYTRDRPLEFAARDIEREELVRRIEATRDLVGQVVGALGADALDSTYPEPYDGVAISTRQFLVHLFGHLSYHLGQVNYVRRVVTERGPATRP